MRGVHKQNQLQDSLVDLKHSIAENEVAVTGRQTEELEQLVNNCRTSLMLD